MSSTPGERSTIASLQPVPGNLPDLKRDDLPACRFAERCERATERCRSERPRLRQAARPHGVACWFPLHEAAPLAEPVHADTRARSVAAGGRTARSAPQRMPEPLLQVEALHKRFAVSGRRGAMLHAVDDVSLHIGPGESVGLVGESGCGKSTLVRLLARLLDPSDGRIVFAGQELGEIRAERFARSAAARGDPDGVPGPHRFAEPALQRARGDRASRCGC